MVRQCVNRQLEKPVPCNSLTCGREAAPHQKARRELRFTAGLAGAPKKLQSRPGEGSQIHLTDHISRQVHSHEACPGSSWKFKSVGQDWGYMGLVSSLSTT